jgi:hypothetical protein
VQPKGFSTASQPKIAATILALFKPETFVKPSGNPAHHDLDWPPEPGKANRTTRRTIAMRAGTVGHEQRVVRPLVHFEATIFP